MAQPEKKAGGSNHALVRALEDVETRLRILRHHAERGQPATGRTAAVLEQLDSAIGSVDRARHWLNPTTYSPHAEEG